MSRTASKAWAKAKGLFYRPFMEPPYLLQSVWTVMIVIRCVPPQTITIAHTTLSPSLRPGQETVLPGDEIPFHFPSSFPERKRTHTYRSELPSCPSYIVIQSMSTSPNMIASHPPDASRRTRSHASLVRVIAELSRPNATERGPGERSGEGEGRGMRTASRP